MRVGGCKNTKTENVVKRTVRYQFEEGFWNNGGMTNENVEVRSKNEELEIGAGTSASSVEPREAVSERPDASREGTVGGKARSDSILSGLPPEQQAKVKAWLFDENLSFGAVMGRCQRELGVEVSKSSVMRYYRREVSRRRLEAALGRRESGPDAVGGDANEYYGELLATAGEMALESARGELDAEKRRAFVECTKLLIAARREGNYARRVDLAREKFEFDAATACIIRQMEINSIIEDETLTDEERIRSVREELFGENLPE